jgi:hypothetical protein
MVRAIPIWWRRHLQLLPNAHGLPEGSHHDAQWCRSKEASRTRQEETRLFGGIAMTGAQAAKILQHPRFGDESHIEALGIYRQFAQVKGYRDQADEIDMDALDEFYADRETPKPEDLTADQLDEEIDFWESAGEWGL